MLLRSGHYLTLKYISPVVTYAAETWTLPVSYTHLDVYKRQLLLIRVYILKFLIISRRSLCITQTILTFPPTVLLQNYCVPLSLIFDLILYLLNIINSN